MGFLQRAICTVISYMGSLIFISVVFFHASNSQSNFHISLIQQDSGWNKDSKNEIVRFRSCLSEWDPAAWSWASTAILDTVGHPLQPPATIPEACKSFADSVSHLPAPRDLLDSLKDTSTASDIYLSFLLYPVFLQPDYTPPSTDVNSSPAPLEWTDVVTLKRILMQL